MIELIGLIFMGIWAAGKAKQKGKNQYVWSLVPVGVYVVFYIIAFVIMHFGYRSMFTPGEDNGTVVTLVIKVLLIPISFIASKLLLDRLLAESKE